MSTTSSRWYIGYADSMVYLLTGMNLWTTRSNVDAFLLGANFVLAPHGLTDAGSGYSVTVVTLFRSSLHPGGLLPPRCLQEVPLEKCRVAPSLEAEKRLGWRPHWCSRCEKLYHCMRLIEILCLDLVNIFESRKVPLRHS